MAVPCELCREHQHSRSGAIRPVSRLWGAQRTVFLASSTTNEGKGCLKPFQIFLGWFGVSGLKIIGWRPLIGVTASLKGRIQEMASICLAMYA